MTTRADSVASVTAADRPVPWACSGSVGGDDDLRRTAGSLINRHHHETSRRLQAVSIGRAGELQVSGSVGLNVDEAQLSRCEQFGTRRLLFELTVRGRQNGIDILVPARPNDGCDVLQPLLAGEDALDCDKSGS